MSLNEYSDQALRKWCVEKVLAHGREFAKTTTESAETLFQYIKYGPDNGCVCCDENDPCGPINTGPGMEMLRSPLQDDGFHFR